MSSDISPSSPDLGSDKTDGLRRSFVARRKVVSDDVFSDPFSPYTSSVYARGRPGDGGEGLFIDTNTAETAL